MEVEHNQEHQASVKRVDENFVDHQVASGTLLVLDDTIETTRQNESTGGKQSCKMFAPRSLGAFRPCLFPHTEPKQRSGDDIEAKRSNLEAESNKNNCTAPAHCFGVVYLCDLDRTYSTRQPLRQPYA
jgi:hypothetical protein